MQVTDEIIQKWSNLIGYCKSYYVDCVPTGVQDSVYDDLERRALLEDGFSVRDYVFDTYLKGTKTLNSGIDKIKKSKISGEFSSVVSEYGPDVYWTLKYDGSSIAIYLDPTTGRPLRVVTVGNLNINDYGVDQTWKLMKFLPGKFPLGIKAIQAEALIDTSRLPDSPEKARQKANGLINSKYAQSEVDNLLTLRAFRYFPDLSIPEGQYLAGLDYKTVLESFETVYSRVDGHIKFTGAQVWTPAEVVNVPVRTMTDTDTGRFLNDGWVVYSKDGKCLGAHKFSGAGSESEVPVTKVLGIQWNSQVQKGKDSWSANVLIEPVTIGGSTIRKPSAGSVKKLVSESITAGATVSVILANSTIPMIGECKSPGNGNYEWPTCECGYTMGISDVFGSLLKCGNPGCTQRRARMYDYLASLPNVQSLDLDPFLVIDRFKWATTDVSVKVLLDYIPANDPVGFGNYLSGFMKTDLQKRTLALVVPAAWDVLRKIYEDSQPK